MVCLCARCRDRHLFSCRRTQRKAGRSTLTIDSCRPCGVPCAPWLTSVRPPGLGLTACASALEQSALGTVATPVHELPVMLRLVSLRIPRACA